MNDVEHSLLRGHQKAGDMADPLAHLHERLVERVRQIVEDHRAEGVGSDGRWTCNCGEQGLSDQSRHVADKILAGLAVKPDVDDVRQRVRYASAWFDWELTLLEGAEC
jgi:hypothetical protein